MASPAAVLNILVTANTGQAVRALGQTQVALQATERSSGRAMKAVATGAKIAGFGIAALGVVSLKAAGDFEQSLNVFQAVSGATGKQMARVSALSKRLGADVKLPATSAKDAAEAMTELAKGGLSVRDSMKAARGVLQLSAAAQIDNASAATIAADALNAFNLNGKQATRVADLLAAASNASTAEITDVAMSLQQSAASAHQMRVPVEDLTTAISLMANAGIKGSDAGTSLKTMMSRFVPDTAKAREAMRKFGIDVFDSQGQFIGLRAAIKEYRGALGGLTREEQQRALKVLFGSDAQRAANIVLLGGVDAYDKMRDAVTRQGAAQDLATAKTKGFKGAIEAFKSTAETLAITLGQHLLPAATNALRGLTQFVSGMESGQGAGGAFVSTLSSIGGAVRSLVNGFRDGEAGARLLAAGLGAVAAGFVTFKALTTAAAAVSALRAAWVALTAVIASNPIGLVAVAVGALIGALGILSIKTRENEVSSRAFNDALLAQRDAMREVAGIELEEAQRRANLRSATVAVEQAERNLKNAVKEHGKESLVARQAEADLRQARISQRRASVDLANAEEDAKTKRQALKDATRTLTEEERKLNSRVNAQITDRQREISGIGESIQAVKRQGGNYQVMMHTVDELRERQRKLRDEINALKSHKVSVDVKFRLTPSPGSSFGSGGVGDGWGVKDSIQKLAQGAMDSGKLGVGPVSGTGLNAFNQFAGMFGVSVGSGLRPGARTASGNLSYHALGRARDFPGPPGAMLAFAQFMAASFGPILKELIHTPLGFSIKNGRRVPPYAQADHYDHVHVAMRRGGKVPGQGAGDRVPALLEPGEFVMRKKIVDRFGPTFFTNMNRMKDGGIVQAARAAQKAGFRGRNLVNAVAVAGAESGWAFKTNYNPPIEISKSPWQINLLAHPWAKGMVGTWGGSAKAAYRVWKQAGGSFSPWSVWPGKAGAYMARARKAVAALGKGKGKGKGKGGGTTGGWEIGAPTNPWQPLAPNPDFPWERVGPEPSIGGGGGGGGDVGPDPNIARLADLTAEMVANQRKLIYLSETQGPQVVGAVVAAVNGSIGGRLGLGFSGIRSAAGDVAGL